jgi:hypothetical protein
LTTIRAARGGVTRRVEKKLEEAAEQAEREMIALRHFFSGAADRALKLSFSGKVRPI